MENAVDLDKWEEVKTEWGRAAQTGWQSIQQAAQVGQMLLALKEETPHRKFSQTCEKLAGIDKDTRSRIMTLAKHLPLLQEHKPSSQHAALKLIRVHSPRSATTKKEPAPDADSNENTQADTAAQQPSGIEIFLTREEFDLIRECLDAEGIPADLQRRFAQALEIINKHKA